VDKETNTLLSNVAEQVGKKVDQVLSGTTTFPEYRILTIDRRLISGETKKAYILAAPNSLNISETYFVPKSMTSPNPTYFSDFQRCHSSTYVRYLLVKAETFR